MDNNNWDGAVVNNVCGDRAEEGTLDGATASVSNNNGRCLLLLSVGDDLVTWVASNEDALVVDVLLELLGLDHVVLEDLCLLPAPVCLLLLCGDVGVVGPDGGLEWAEAVHKVDHILLLVHAGEGPLEGLVRLVADVSTHNNVLAHGDDVLMKKEGERERGRGGNVDWGVVEEKAKEKWNRAKSKKAKRRMKGKIAYRPKSASNNERNENWLMISAICLRVDCVSA